MKVSTILALFCLATVARSQTPVTYVGSTGETFALYAYEGERTALLVDSADYDPALLRRMLVQMDYFWSAFVEATGRQPSPYKTYNSKPTLAVLKTDKLAGAAVGYVGATGVEFSNARFRDWYNYVVSASYDSDFLYAYEFARNFWFFGGKLDSRELNPGAQDASRVFGGFVFFPSIFKWWARTGVTNQTYQWTETDYYYNEIAQVATNFVLDPSATYKGVLLNGAYFPMNRNQQGNGNIMQGLLIILQEEYGDLLTNRFWKEVAGLPSASTAAAVIDNYVVAASRAVSVDLGKVFENQFKLPVSSAAKATLASLPARTTSIPLRRSLRIPSAGSNILLDPQAAFDGGRSEWFFSGYLPPVMPTRSSYNPNTGSAAIRLTGFNTQTFAAGYMNTILRTVPIVSRDGRGRTYRLSGWAKATGLKKTQGISAMLSFMLYSSDQGNWNEFLPESGIKGTHNTANFSFDWVYFETYGTRANFDPKDEHTWIMADVRVLCSEGEVLVSDLVVEELATPLPTQELVIVKDISSRNVSIGGSLTLSFGVSLSKDAGLVGYSWYKNDQLISGANQGSYAIPQAEVGDAGSYHSVAYNDRRSGSSVQSRTAVVTVVLPTIGSPTFTTQPLSQTVTAGNSVTFSSAASGNPTPTYQWQKGGVNISGATSATYTIASTAAGDAGTYAVVATNSSGFVTSATAALTVSAALAAPNITTQPLSQTVTAGTSVTFTAAASSNPTTTYQWQKDGITIAGAASATYTIANPGTGDAGSYTVVAINSSGVVTSSAASLTVNLAPPVLPTTQMVITGKPVALGIVTSTTGTIKWQVSTDSGATYTDLADNATYRGTTTAVLEILLATNALNNNRYRYQVTLSGQTTASTATTLSVKPAYLLMPVGLKIDSANNLYVTDAAAQVIVKITSDFKIASLAGTAIAMGSADGTGTVARFNEPTDLVINDDGSFLLTDTSNASVRKVTTAGVVTTFAGTSGSKGSADGTSAAARFSAPVGITRDTAGNVYVADQTNHVIRRVTPAGVVTTLAGTAGAAGSTDGTGAAARFNLPTGVAMNSTDLIYVADFGSHTLRKVTSSGVVTTFAGTAGTSGSVDGTGTAARFNKPSGLALDTAGNLYVADTGNSTVRKVSPAGVVTTLAGLSAIAGLKDGTGALAWFNEPEGVTADASGNLYLADTGNAVIRKITSTGVVTTLALTGTVPVITTQPASVSVTTGSSASLSVTASGDGVLTYQWKKDGTDVAGATTATYAISATSSTSAGSYTVVVSNFLGSVTSSAATLTVNAAPAPVPTPAPSSGGGGGGGGGAVSPWFIGALGMLLLVRRTRRRE